MAMTTMTTTSPALTQTKAVAASKTAPAMTAQTPAPAPTPPPGGGGGGGGGGGRGAGGGQPPAAPPVQPQAQLPIFALTPGQYHPNNFIDYGSAQGLKLWNAAMQALPMEFNAESDGVKQFCELLTQRATESGWASGNGDIINIPDGN